MPRNIGRTTDIAKQIPPSRLSSRDNVSSPRRSGERRCADELAQRLRKRQIEARQEAAERCEDRRRQRRSGTAGHRPLDSGHGRNAARARLCGTRLSISHLRAFSAAERHDHLTTEIAPTVEIRKRPIPNHLISQTGPAWEVPRCSRQSQMPSRRAGDDAARQRPTEGALLALATSAATRSWSGRCSTPPTTPQADAAARGRPRSSLPARKSRHRDGTARRRPTRLCGKQGSGAAASAMRSAAGLGRKREKLRDTQPVSSPSSERIRARSYFTLAFVGSSNQPTPLRRGNLAGSFAAAPSRGRRSQCVPSNSVAGAMPARPGRRRAVGA